MDSRHWLWAAAIGCVVLALVSGVSDWRRRRRRDLDRIGMIDWPTVQVLALIAAAILGFLAIKS